MRMDDCTDRVPPEEKIIYRFPSVMGSQIVVRWHPEYGITSLAHELQDGTRLKFEVYIPTTVRKEFKKSRFRLFLDSLLDRLF